MRTAITLLATLALTGAACSSSTTTGSAGDSARSQSLALQGTLCPDSWYDATPPNPSWPPLIDMVPIQYDNTDEVLGLFPASLDVLQGLLPPSLSPLPIAQGVGMLAVTFFTYKDIVGMHPYREVDLSILVYDLPTLSEGYNPFYVRDLVLTSKQGVWAGIQGWGYNKVLGNVVCAHIDPNGFQCTAQTEAGLVVAMHVTPTGPEVPAQPQPLALLSVKDSFLVRAPFVESSGADSTFSESYTATLEVGDNPIAKPYLSIGRTSIGAAVGRHLNEELSRGYCAPL